MPEATAETHVRTPSPSPSHFTPLSPPLRTPSPRDDYDDKSFRSGTPRKRPSPSSEDMSPVRRVQRRLDASVNPYSRSPCDTEIEQHGSGETEDERRSPRGRRGREEFVRDEVVVPSHAVGFIIGRQGETIRAIMASSGAHVSMDRNFPGPDRKFDITGTAGEVKNCRKVMLDKLDVVRERSHERTGSKGEDNFEMWIPQGKIGLVIGVGGGNIRLINERSGAHCTVQNDRVRDEQKLVIITGTQDAIQIAEDMILEVLHGRAETKAIYIPRDAVGFVIGKNGVTIKNLMAKSGAVIRVSSEEGEERIVTIQGSPRVIEDAHNMIDEVIDKGFTQERYHRERRVESSVERLSSQRTIRNSFQLSAEHIGLLIGKHGTTIREMQNRSGATIEVSGKMESEREASTRTVLIVGSKAQVKIARILIEEKLGLDDDDDEGIDSPKSSVTRFKNDITEEERKSNGDKLRRHEESSDESDEKSEAKRKQLRTGTALKCMKATKSDTIVKKEKAKCTKSGMESNSAPMMHMPPPHGYPPYAHPPHGQYPPHYPPPSMFGEQMHPYSYYSHPPSGHGIPPGAYPPHPGLPGYSRRDSEKEGMDSKTDKETKNLETTGQEPERQGVPPSYGYGYGGHPLPYPPPMFGGYPYGPPPSASKQRSEKETEAV